MAPFFSLRRLPGQRSSSGSSSAIWTKRIRQNYCCCLLDRHPLRRPFVDRCCTFLPHGRFDRQGTHNASSSSWKSEVSFARFSSLTFRGDAASDVFSRRRQVLHVRRRRRSVRGVSGRTSQQVCPVRKVNGKFSCRQTILKCQVAIGRRES